MESNNQIRFCSYCGTKLDNGAKFCKSCGNQVPAFKNNSDVHTKNNNQDQIEEPLTERKTIYEGSIHKCPNCGEALEAFVTNCPSCGYEIRDVKSSSSVRELATKLEKIEAQKMPHIEEKKSLMKMLVGKDFKKEDEVEEAQERFDEQKRQEKATLIINFSVPNTKEDILEFMILASSNINVKDGLNDDVTRAWLSKLEQVYERAKLLMGNSPDFAHIKYIYDKKKNEIKNRKFKGLATASFIVGGFALLMGLMFFPVGITVAGVIGVFVGVALIMLGIKFISIYNKNKRENQ